MPNVSSKEQFIKELKKFTNTSHGNNIEIDFLNEIIINETEADGRGEIYLDISNYTTNENFFIKITHQPNHSIGENVNHNDGIVLKVNLINKQVDIFMFELKTQLRFSNLKTASKQLASAYKFMKYLHLEECFNVNYKFFLVYNINNIERDSDELKGNKNYYDMLFEAVYEKKDKIPLMVPLCKYKEYDFAQLNFGARITI